MKFPVMTSLSLPFTAVRQHNDRLVTFQMQPDSTLLGLVTTITPQPKKRLYSVPHSQLPLKNGINSRAHSSEGKLMDCSITGDAVDFSFKILLMEKGGSSINGLEARLLSAWRGGLFLFQDMIYIYFLTKLQNN